MGRRPKSLTDKATSRLDESYILCKRILHGLKLRIEIYNLSKIRLYKNRASPHRDDAIVGTNVYLTGYIPVNTKHLYYICTMLDQSRRRWADVVQMLYIMFCFCWDVTHRHEIIYFPEGRRWQK